MDRALDEAVNNLWDGARRALEDAAANARLVERLEEETKKLKELTDSFNEKRMKDEKEMEEMRLRMELEETEQKEKKRRSEEAEAMAAEADDALAAFMLEQYGKVKIFLGDSGDFYWGYPPRPSPAPVCSPTSPAETSLASCHESDEERVLRLANWPLDHPSPSDGPIAPVGERIDAAIKEIREDRKFHRKRGWPSL